MNIRAHVFPCQNVLIQQITSACFFCSLKAKIARLSKKFGEANQATENKKKQEVGYTLFAFGVPVFYGSFKGKSINIFLFSSGTRCCCKCCCFYCQDGTWGKCTTSRVSVYAFTQLLLFPF